MARTVTERDLRMPEFREAKLEDLEFREDGKLVRKDRREVTVRNIVSVIGWARREFELPEVVAEVRRRFCPGIDGSAEYDSWFVQERPCETCNGVGTIDECPDCDGAGVTST